MMKKLIWLIAGSFLLLARQASAQQDAQYSQYMFNGIYINPAYAGYKEVLNVHSFYRSQWTGITGAPRSMSLAVDAIANSGNVGLALQVASDKLGAQTNLSIYGNYSYRIRMNDDGSSRLALGLGIGMVQLGIDGSLLNPNNPEPNQPVGMQSTIVPDARAGIYFANDKFYAGFSADNLIATYINIDRYAFIPQPKPHYYLTAGALFPLSEDFQVKPSFLLKDDRGGPTSLDLNAFLMIKDFIWVGGSYRTGVKLYNKSYLQRDLTPRNSAVAAIQIFPSQKLRIGYGYDFSIGPLQGYSSGTHEISIAYSFIRQNVRLATPRVF
ncbi:MULTISPECIES: type IX secretion system membrane protein PorP/SprF [unclassified Pedobacter]|uniref:PorP/SprF family type IX secretion system membrane protein n=1 Tax=unclassified Pedobacter TaxID=2628915 RepID=UPI0017A3CFEF|nr:MULTISPECIES: type IX secretion system membrane protein PorP/SprF [unclassified Pedobacter]NII82319.1 type IX secretion system PorP/SprF family membrane protein [Pedobacter sp. SG908]NMN36344.1 type IX secretion system PorP/SprF family membrane protein [Pedobacter sp. SG918]